MKQLFLTIIFTLSLVVADAQSERHFTNPDELLAFAVKNSIALKTGDAQRILAKYQTLYAKINRFNPRASVNYAATDNIQQAVNFLPAEIFGGAAGSFKETKLGKRYVQNITITPQIDLINPINWAKLESAKTTEQLIALNNTLTRKTLSESIVAAYFNIVSFQKQINITAKTLLNADSILQIIQNKQAQGIARSQDVNHAKVTILTIQDRIQQLKNAQEQQYNLLKLLCDIDNSTTIVIDNAETSSAQVEPVISPNTLHLQQTQLQLQYAQNEFKVHKSTNYPTLSLVGNLAWQENSNLHFFDGSTRWIPANYVGLRFSYWLPDATRFAQTAVVKNNIQIAELSVQRQTVQQAADYRQLQLEYQKAEETAKIAKEIGELKEDTYRKNLNLFVQDIYPADNLFISFNDALAALLNYQSALINLDYQIAKIKINNSIR